MDEYSIGYALLSAQRALLEAVDPSLRAVVVDYLTGRTLLHMRFYYDGEPSEKLIENWSCAINEASTGIGTHCYSDFGAERIDYPKKLPFEGRYAYLRKEEGQDQYIHHLNRTSLKGSTSQTLLNQRDPKHKKFMHFGKPIGDAIDRDTGKRILTSWGLIQKRKDEFRILPAYEDPNADPDRKAYPVAYAMLALQSALLGRVVPALRFVTADYDKNQNLFYLRVYYDGEVSKNLIDEWEDALFETCADLGKDFLFEMTIERCDFPNQPIITRPTYDQRFACYNEKGVSNGSE